METPGVRRPPYLHINWRGGRCWIEWYKRNRRGFLSFFYYLYLLPVFPRFFLLHKIIMDLIYYPHERVRNEKGGRWSCWLHCVDIHMDIQRVFCSPHWHSKWDPYNVSCLIVPYFSLVIDVYYFNLQSFLFVVACCTETRPDYLVRGFLYVSRALIATRRNRLRSIRADALT